MEELPLTGPLREPGRMETKVCCWIEPGYLCDPGCPPFTLIILSLQYVGILAGLLTGDIILGRCQGEDFILTGARDVYG